jgi:hypothetical protein
MDDELKRKQTMIELQNKKQMQQQEEDRKAQ